VQALGSQRLPPEVLDIAVLQLAETTDGALLLLTPQEASDPGIPSDFGPKGIAVLPKVRSQ